MDLKTDFLVIGSGIAGLMYAIEVARYGSVIIVTKKKAADSNTNLAQGGIASVLDLEDSFDLHIQDTLHSGAGICNKSVVNNVITSGPKQIKKLVDMGVKFNKKNKSINLDLGREGGHSRNRIVHSQDMTGQEIERILLEKIYEEKKITILEDHMAIDLITSVNNIKQRVNGVSNKSICHGAYILNRNTKKVKIFLSKITFLASGGVGRVYIYTSNPDIATGDGIAMGYRAGATIANLEFVQFHPTSLYHPSAKNFLISETVRGEGGVLIDKAGKSFMDKYDPLKELACRDTVARAIDIELKKTKQNSVFLDISHRSTDFIIDRFPNLYEKCIDFGFDITKEPIPVVPAAHYMCGGIVTSVFGETNVDRLYSAGETAYTGLHGANRLASNSLLEALVYAHSAANHVSRKISKINHLSEFKILKWEDKRTLANNIDLKVINYNLNKVRSLMWKYVGIVRSDKKLIKALACIKEVQNDVNKIYRECMISPDFIEFKNVITVAKLITVSAYQRKESRGLHYNINYPQQNNLTWKKISTIQLKDIDKSFKIN